MICKGFDNELLIAKEPRNKWSSARLIISAALCIAEANKTLRKFIKIQFPHVVETKTWPSFYEQADAVDKYWHGWIRTTSTCC